MKQKINELMEIEAHLDYLQSQLKEVETIGLHQTTLTYHPTRYFIRYDCVSRNELELKINIR